MSLISSISSSVVYKLSGKANGSYSQSFGSVGKSKSSTSSSVDISTISKTGTTAFTNSLTRINAVVKSLNITSTHLSDLQKVNQELLTIAKQASLPTTTSSTRASLSTSFLDLLSKFDTIRDDTSSDGADLLSKEAIKAYLDNAGINLSADPKLNAAYNALGGNDDEVGTDIISPRQRQVGTKQASGPTKPDPMFGRSVKNRAEAALSVDILKKVQEQIDTDLASVNNMITEMQGAFLFAQAGRLVFTSLDRITNSSDPDIIAQSIVTQLKLVTEDKALDVHSSIDSKLAKELLT